MRLPAITPEQREREASRALHEEIWAGYLVHTAVILPATDDIRAEVKSLGWRLHKFWKARGYTLHCKQLGDRSGIRIWLAPITGLVSELASGEGAIVSPVILRDQIREQLRHQLKP